MVRADHAYEYSNDQLGAEYRKKLLKIALTVTNPSIQFLDSAEIEKQSDDIGESCYRGNISFSHRRVDLKLRLSLDIRADGAVSHVSILESENAIPKFRHECVAKKVSKLKFHAGMSRKLIYTLKWMKSFNSTSDAF